MSCFDLSGFTPVPESLLIKYRQAWVLFNTVQANDIMVSTARSQGDSSKSYWVFETNQQKTMWLQGQRLHVQRYPNLDWSAPQKN